MVNSLDPNTFCGQILGQIRISRKQIWIRLFTVPVYSTKIQLSYRITAELSLLLIVMNPDLLKFMDPDLFWHSGQIYKWVGLTNNQEFENFLVLPF